MRICIVTEGTKLEHDSLETGSLGGSETAVACMARELSKRGHKVAVFAKTEQEGEFDGIEWYNVGKFPVVSLFAQWDVLVVSRYAQYLAAPTNAGMRVLWLHDVIQDAGGLAQCLFQTDEIFALTDWHIANYTDGTPEQNKMPHFKKHFWKTSNGVDIDLIKANLRPKEPKKLLYTSRPERGLLFLLRDVMPKLVEADPEITLSYCAYDLPGFPLSQEVQEISKACDDFAKRLPKNVKKLGALSKAQLYQEMSSSQIWAYVSRFEETFCLGAIEAAACGTAVVSTKLAALNEVVSNSKNGILIPGLPGNEEYTKRYVETVLYLLNKKPERLKQFQEYGPKWVQQKGYTWAKVAERWEKHFVEVFENRIKAQGGKIVTEMLRHNDLIPAKRLSESLGLDNAQVDAAFAELTPAGPKNYNDVQRLLSRYDGVLARLHSRQIKPKKVLDLHCGPAAFGLNLVKRNSTVEVVMVDSNPEIRAQITKSLANLPEQAQNRVRVMSEEEIQPEKGTFDFLFSGDQLEQSEDPAAFLRGLAAWVTEDGHVAVTSGFGAPTATIRDTKYTRKWNLGYYDFEQMFANENFVATVLDDGIGTGGDLLGHWLCIFTKPQAANTKPFDINHRARIYRPYVSLGVAMIAKDAEEWIIKCLNHLKDQADYIQIALDDRTKDHTMSLAYEHGADNVFPVKFEDFSQMRNKSLEGLDQDWIFWVDTDEMLVDGAKLRRYLRSPIYEGYGCKQAHLMLDVHGTYDLPVRFFRNRPHVKFSGYIHEMALDQSKSLYDDAIQPSILIPDCQLAHYGYMNEVQRRNKCSNRNMELLIKDAKENGNKGRMISWVLVIRDYLNVAKWRLERSKMVVQHKSIEHLMLQAAVRTYLKYFTDPKCKYHALAFPMYQEALALLGMSGVPFEERPTPPFEVRCALWGAVGGCQTENVEPKKVWFIDFQQFLAYMTAQTGELGARAGVVPVQAVEPMLRANQGTKYTWNENDLDLLLLGTNNIDATTGRLIKA